MKRIALHIAVLSLVATWLLLVPPREARPFGQFRVMTEAPLSQWGTIGTFPSQDDCGAAFHPKLLLPELNGPSIWIGTGTVATNGKLYKANPPPPEGARCVSADDPGLK